MNENDSPEEHNPFRSPPRVTASLGQGSRDVPAGVDPRLYRNAGRVRQVRPVAICLIIHGILIALIGAGLTFAAIFLANMGPEMFSDAEVNPSIFQGAITWGYGIVGGGMLLLGLLSIFAGIRNLSFRSRTLGIVALSAGVVTSLGVWCAPTAIGLAIWGLIVYLDPSVERAFELTSKGTKPKEILAMVRRDGS